MDAVCTFDMCTEFSPVHLWVEKSTAGHDFDPSEQNYWKAQITVSLLLLLFSPLPTSPLQACSALSDPDIYGLGG
jgi:hypothetical protein